MDDPNENTAVIDMKRNFQRFLTDDENRKRSRLDFSETSLMDSSHASVNQSYGRDPDALRVKTDLLYSKSRIAMLESQLNSKESEIKEQASLHEREIFEIKRLHDRELRGYTVLKTSHERVLHRQECCEAELREEKDNLAQYKLIYDEKIRELQKRNMEQDSSHTDLLEEQKAKYRELRNKCMALQADLAVATGELSQAKEQISDMKKKLSDSLSTSTDSEEWKSRALQTESEMKSLQQQLSTYQDDMLVMTARKQDLAKLASISEENKKLHSRIDYYRATVENIEVMKEHVHTMERKIQKYNELESRVAELQVENESYDAQLLELQSRQIPQDTVARLRDAQDKEIVMLENIGELKSSNRLLEARVQELVASGNVLGTRLSGAGNESEVKNKRIEKLQQRISLLIKERDGYKRIIDSYEVDITREIVPHSSDKSTHLQQMLNSYSKAHQELEKECQKLEEDNSSLRQCNAELSAQLSTKASEPLPAAASMIDQSQLVQLRQVIEGLENRCERLAQDKDLLEARIEQRNLQGDYDPTKTKVVHLSMNPATLAERAKADELRLLREDCVRLRERVKVLEGNLADAQNITAQVEANLNDPSVQESQKLKEMKSKLASCEKKSERMMDMFKKTSLEFRQVVYQLTGYRIDVPKSKEYKLMSMYASSPDDYLLFQETSDGDLQLLENDFAATLEELAAEHLQNQGAIPIFLSSLTIDLFKQSTMMTSMM